MKVIKIGGLEIGSGMPKICAPIVEGRLEDILKQAEEIAASPAKIAEWRCDFAEEQLVGAEDMLLQLRRILRDKLLLVTLRTEREGGHRDITPEEYLFLCKRFLDFGLIDMLDVELSAGEEVYRELIRTANIYRVCTIISKHFFDGTPSSEDLRSLMLQMDRSGASILKIAAMPHEKNDVLRLMQEGHAFHEKCMKPMIYISMGEMGLTSRLTGELTGSCITFGTVGKASAPGQIDVWELDRILRVVHGN